MGKDWEQPKDKQIKEWLQMVQESLAAVQKIEVARKGSTQASRPARSLVLALASPPAVAEQSRGCKNASLAVDQMKKTLVELQFNVSEITAKGQNLAGAKLTLKDIKEILNDCIDYVITLKHHITHIVVFFRTFKPRVYTVLISQIKPFEGKVEKIINNHNLLFDLMLLQSNAIQIWASFEQFKDIADMYRQIYKPHLIDGLLLVDQMTRLRKETNFASQLEKIENWKKTVQGQVDQIVEKQISEVKRVLNEDEKDLLESRLKLPAAPFWEQLAIERGAVEARKENIFRIEEVNPALENMGKTHKDQPIEVRYINKNFSSQQVMIMLPRRAAQEEIEEQKALLGFCWQR
ncbi:uncharacterized protein EAF01_002098 [Botrytis porri]|uniref:Uncharacterized protein n=1 Tax=Botrytis porri TaxID=87229 RepID=A0A4Z1L674_9HELO|nr:uncharacterized protein EAF01_002098 [Botrytis porri]KAF7910587.1 hypothetical protein EAF01_002098 [Botrytis porri]TGO92265.1 hypothetical protein BPOR_0006g00050 [Botrytis porri]